MDICRQERLIPPNNTLKFQFLCNEPRFLLLTNDEKEYSVQIKEAVLKIQKLELFPDVHDSFTAVFNKEPCIYHVLGSHFKQVEIAKGSTSVNIENLFNSSIIPSYCVLSFCDTSALSAGSYTKNPHYHPHKNLSSITITIAGNTKQRFLNFANKQYLGSYLEFLEVVGKHAIPFNAVNYISFAEGYSFLALNNKYSNAEGGNLIPEISKGNAVLNLRFSKPLDSNVSLLIYFKVPQKITLSRDKSVEIIPHLN